MGMIGKEHRSPGFKDLIFILRYRLGHLLGSRRNATVLSGSSFTGKTSSSIHDLEAGDSVSLRDAALQRFGVSIPNKEDEKAGLRVRAPFLSSPRYLSRSVSEGDLRPLTSPLSISPARPSSWPGTNLRATIRDRHGASPNADDGEAPVSPPEFVYVRKSRRPKPSARRYPHIFIPGDATYAQPNQGQQQEQAQDAVDSGAQGAARPLLKPHGGVPIPIPPPQGGPISRPPPQDIPLPIPRPHGGPIERPPQGGPLPRPTHQRIQIPRPPPTNWNIGPIHATEASDSSSSSALPHPGFFRRKRRVHGTMPPPWLAGAGRRRPGRMGGSSSSSSINDNSSIGDDEERQTEDLGWFRSVATIFGYRPDRVDDKSSSRRRKDKRWKKE